MARILLMEDDPGDAFDLTNELQNMGHEVTWARTCDAAMREADQQAFDVVVTDIFVRDTDGILPRGGITLIGKLRSVRRTGATPVDVPIIAVSVAFSGEWRADYIEGNAKSVGATKTLAKPFDALALHEMIGDCLANAQRRVSTN